MSDYDDSTNESNPIRTLRERGDAAEARAKAAEERLAALETQLRTTTVTNVLTNRGVPEKVARLIPNDVEATPDAIGKWLDEYGDVFTPKQQAAEQSGDPAPSAEQKPSISQEAVSQLSAIQAVESGATSDAPVGVERSIAKLNELRGRTDLSFQQITDLLVRGEF